MVIGLFARAYGDARSGLILAGAASTLVFGLRHGLAYDGAWHLAWLPFAFLAAVGGVLMSMRGVTGSALPSIVAHNAANVLGTIAAAAP